MSRGIPFPPGNKFGRGRPKGSRNKSTIAALELLYQHGADVARKCIADALRGNKMAMKLCMDRIAPVRREAPVKFALPAVNTASEVAQALNVVLQAIAGGRLTPEEGRTVSNVLETKRRSIETAELEARILALESSPKADEPEEFLEDPQHKGVDHAYHLSQASTTGGGEEGVTGASSGSQNRLRD